MFSLSSVVILADTSRGLEVTWCANSTISSVASNIFKARQWKMKWAENVLTIKEVQVCLVKQTFVFCKPRIGCSCLRDETGQYFPASTVKYVGQTQLVWRVIDTPCDVSHIGRWNKSPRLRPCCAIRF